MEISVIVPTYNGANKILNILSSLDQQNFKDFEIILVIDGSTDNTYEIVKKNPVGLENLKIILQENGGRSVARNQGAKKASGDLLIFFDDDMRPTPNAISQHLKHHQSYQNTILVGTQLEEFSKMKTDIQQYKAHLSRKWESPLKQNQGLVPKSKPFLTAANFSIPRKLFWDLNGFDEALTDAEDFDLAIRAVLKGIPIYFKSEIMAWHDDFITAKSYVLRQLQYEKAHQKLRELKPNLYSQFNQYKIAQPKGFKRMIYRFFAFPFWIWMIDNFNFLKLIPRKMRYKFYDIIIFGNVLFYKD